MNVSWKRIRAIFMKDYKDFTRNMAVSGVVLMVPILAAVYGRIGTSNLEAYYTIINMAFVLVGSFVQSCLIAEEKEKDTLRGLMLSPANTMEILIGKILLTFLVTAFVIVVGIYFVDYRPENYGYISLAIILSLLFYIGVGTLLGLYAKSVMEASVLVMPIAFIFTFGTFISILIEQYPVLKIANYLPNIQLLILAEKVEEQATFTELFSHLGIISIWLIIVSVVTVITYRKRMID